jgi:hypothetical protein
MGKTQENPKGSAERPSAGTGGTALVVEGTAEQREKNRAAVEWLERRQLEYETLSPDQKQELERQWEQFERMMNENHPGPRRVYLD